MPDKLTLYVCHINDGGPKPHACRRAHEALREAGHDYETVIFGKGHRFGLFTTGRRPRLKEISGQEKLPVLQWPDGTTIAGSGNIVAWAKANRPERLGTAGMGSAPASRAEGVAGPSPSATLASEVGPPEGVGERAMGPVALVEFPADDPGRARRFWSELLGIPLEPRGEGEGAGWHSRSQTPAIGVHMRGRGPGDSFSLPYFRVDDLPAALQEVEALGGSVVHPGESWAICKDSEGSPFGLTGVSAGNS
jgi:predicted enzyme related to lactoylglutathione lyase